MDSTNPDQDASDLDTRPRGQVQSAKPCPKVRPTTMSCVDNDRQRFDGMVQELINGSEIGDILRTQKRRKREIDRQMFMAKLQNFCGPWNRPKCFHSIPAIRMQLQAEFIHRHYAKEGEDFFPSKLILLDTPDTADFAAAANALYLTQLATAHGDQRLFQNAARSYQGALQLVRRRLMQPEACHNDHIFGTIHIMSLCEAFRGLSVDDNSRKQHHNGMAVLFQTRGPKSIQNLYMKVQLQQHQQQALIEGLFTRRRPAIGKGVWLSVPKKCHIRLTELTSLALRVPGALEDADSLCRKGSFASPEEIMDLLSTFKNLERELQTWMIQWYTEFDTLPYWKVPASKLPWLRQVIRSESEAFTSALQFPTPLFAKGHVTYWMSLLALLQAIKQVAELHPFPLLAKTLPAQSERLQSQISESADNLAMTAVFLINPLNGIDGHIEACGPLLFASMWFERNGGHDKLEWCYQMFQYIDSRGIRIPKRTPRTITIG